MKTGESYIQSQEKRAFDIAGAWAIGIAATPLAGAAALVLCAERKRLNPVFKQKRVGRNSRPILVNKIRTIPEQGTDGFPDTFGPKDPRASKFGQFVRQIGIDELPQVSNIIRGEMSLVGIRPQVPTVLEQRQNVDGVLFEDWYYCYERNPGLFGAGQAYAHEVGYYKENGEVILGLMKLDIEAFETASLKTDIEAVLSQPVGLVISALHER